MTSAVPEANGVPSPGGGGTPSPLPTAFSADALAVLEFDRALAVVAEHAVGELGAAALRARRPSDDSGWIAGELQVVGEVLALLRRGERIEVLPVPPLRSALARLRVSGSVLELEELLQVKLTAHAGRLIGDELDRVAEPAPFLAAGKASPLPRAVERRLTQAVGDDGELLDSASAELARARREVQAARDRLLRRLERMLRDEAGGAIPAGATVTMREGRYVIPVRRDARQRPEGIIHDESASAGTLFVEPTAAIELGNALREAIADEERAVLAVLRELTDELRPHRDTLAALHAMAIAVDEAVARARWALATDAEIPALREAGAPLVLRQARHPLLLARGIRVVPFDLLLEPGERTVLISGPNTGGKTVLLKTTGLVLALVQAGIVPPIGAGTELPLVRRIFAGIGDHQSLAADLSTFSAHVGELRRVLESADGSTLVLLDEIGSGTDPAEGGALAIAVLASLTDRGALTLATTHLGALKSLATTHRGVVNGSLEFDAATLSPSYRFTKGVPGRSYGLAIARRLGLDPEVLASAERLVPEDERELDRLLAEVESRRQSLAAAEDDLAQRHAAALAQAAQLDRLGAELADRAAELARQEKQAERERGRQAKAYLLEARKRVEEALTVARNAGDEAAAREARRLVEAAIREEAERLEEGEGNEAPIPAQLVTGTRVRLSTGATGELAEVRGDGRAVVTVGAMRLVVTASSLTPIATPPVREKPRAPSPSAEGTREAAWEIDLRGMRADEAEASVLAAIDGAVLAEQPHLAIIHGMGTGVLRDTVRRLLAADRRVASYDFAPRQQGGVGVTIAVLR